MNTTAIAAEIAKLNKSQRNAMRRIVSSPLSCLKVEQVGWTTSVSCRSNGFQYSTALGPKGRKLKPVTIVEG